MACTSSLITIGHIEVTWCGDMRVSNTRKHKNTWAWSDGTAWGSLRQSERRSEKLNTFNYKFEASIIKTHGKKINMTRKNIVYYIAS